MDSKCNGKDCTAVNGVGHSVECMFEHFLAYSGNARLGAVAQNELRRAYFDGHDAALAALADKSAAASDPKPASVFHFTSGDKNPIPEIEGRRFMIIDHPLDKIARVCHEVNRAYCQSLGDDSQPAWEDAPEWQRASARMGVDLHSMGDFGPEASHISWMNQKIEEGWVYGEVKDPEAKTHPCMVPFDQLPREQQAKDFIFRAIVHALRTTVPVEDRHE